MDLQPIFIDSGQRKFLREGLALSRFSMVHVLLNIEMGAGWLGTGWLLTNKMAFDNGCHGAWFILEILACDPSMELHRDGWLVTQYPFSRHRAGSCDILIDPCCYKMPDECIYDWSGLVWHMTFLRVNRALNKVIFSFPHPHYRLLHSILQSCLMDCV